MIDRMLSLLVALSLALLVWLYARSRDQEILDNVPVPVQVTPGPRAGRTLQPGTERPQSRHGLVHRLAPAHPRTAGHAPAQRTAGRRSRSPCRPSICTKARYTDSILVESSDIHTPPGVTAMMVEGRNRISLTLHRLVERRLPVRFDSVSDEPVGPVVIEPATVLVRGPQEVLDRARVDLHAAVGTADRGRALAARCRPRAAGAGTGRPARAGGAQPRHRAAAGAGAEGLRVAGGAGPLSLSGGLPAAAASSSTNAPDASACASRGRRARSCRRCTPSSI